MQYLDADKILRDAFSPRLMRAICETLKKAYSVVDLLTLDNDFLNWEVGYQTKPYLRNAAAEYFIKNILAEKSESLLYVIQSNSAKNHKHLEIYSDNCILTISHVNNPRDFPRDAVFRSNLRMTNQISLFDDANDESPSNNSYYAILTHGKYSLSKLAGPDFIRIGFPYDERRSWIHQIDLLNQPTLVKNDVAPQITEDDLLSIRDEFISGRINKNEASS